MYLEERYVKEDNKIKNLHTFPKEIRKVLTSFANVFDTTLKKSMKVEPAQLKLKEGYIWTMRYTCRPTPPAGCRLHGA